MFYEDEHGDIVHVSNEQILMIRSQDSLAPLAAKMGQGIITPGLVAALPGLAHAWQLKADGTWAQIA